jgi:hypothetical protein
VVQLRRALIALILTCLAIFLLSSVASLRRSGAKSPTVVRTEEKAPSPIAEIPPASPATDNLAPTHSCRLLPGEHPIDDAMIACLEAAVRNGWRGYLAWGYLGQLQGPKGQATCKECRATALRFLLNAPHMHDPVCELLFWYFDDLVETPELKARFAESRAAYPPPQSASEARALILHAIGSPDRSIAYEIGELIGSDHFLPASEVAEEIMTAWFEAGAPVVRSLFGSLVERELIEKMPEWRGRIAKGLLERWDMEVAEGVRIQNLNVARRLLQSDVGLPEALASRLRDRLFLEFRSGYEGGNEIQRVASADVLMQSPLDWSNREVHLTWLEGALAGSSAWSKKQHVIFFFTPYGLRSENGAQARRYADQLANILIRSLPDRGNDWAIPWIQAIYNTGSPTGRAFLESLTSDNPRVMEALRRELARVD